MWTKWTHRHASLVFYQVHVGHLEPINIAPKVQTLDQCFSPKHSTLHHWEGTQSLTRAQPHTSIYQAFDTLWPISSLIQMCHVSAKNWKIVARFWMSEVSWWLLCLVVLITFFWPGVPSSFFTKACFFLFLAECVAFFLFHSNLLSSVLCWVLALVSNYFPIKSAFLARGYLRLKNFTVLRVQIAFKVSQTHMCKTT